MVGYTPAQAAVLTGLPLSAVHKAIDSRLIRPPTPRSGATVRRLLTKEQLIFLQLEAEGLRLLPVRTRRAIAEMLAQAATAEEILEGYSTLNKEKIAIAPLYMRAFPRRGRPSRRPWRGEK